MVGPATFVTFKQIRPPQVTRRRVGVNSSRVTPATGRLCLAPHQTQCSFHQENRTTLGDVDNHQGPNEDTVGMLDISDLTPCLASAGGSRTIRRTIPPPARPGQAYSGAYPAGVRGRIHVRLRSFHLRLGSAIPVARQDHASPDRHEPFEPFMSHSLPQTPLSRLSRS
jgi:hypothetical protein